MRNLLDIFKDKRSVKHNDDDDIVLEKSCDDGELICPYPKLAEPHQLLRMMGYIPPQLGHSIDVHAPLFPLSACIELADEWGTCCEDEKPLPAEQYERAKRYWIYYRKMAEHCKRVDYFNENPTEYYMWLVGSTHETLGAELRSHWDEIETRQ